MDMMTAPADPAPKAGLFTETLDVIAQQVGDAPLRAVIGRLTDVSGGGLQTTLSDVAIGETCRLRDRTSRTDVLGQVIGIRNGYAILAPIGTTEGLSPGTDVIPLREPFSFWMSDALVGEVLDGMGQPVRERSVAGPGLNRCRLDAPAPGLFERRLVDKTLETGIRAIDGMLTLGEGQRVGVFGAPGSGKTSLLGSLARNADADVVVLGLIGERGRELGEFLERQLPPESRKNCVIVASTSDRPAMERIIGAQVATRVAEYFRDRGKKVLLLFDSVTRYARALREVGLAAGEPAVRRGFTPSVYAELPKIIERCGNTHAGSITAIYTVLTENDGVGDPIAEEVRSLTDGHITLSTELAQSGHYPAIDILQSTSRIMNDLVDADHRRAAGDIRALMAKYAEIELLVQVG
ncbi:MAG: FliI/YscN family ATPase, partial [Pseudomonadota bacterium]